MSQFLSKKSKIKLKILAWYQIIGGVIGILISIALLARTDQISGLLLILFLVAFGLYGFSVYCGRLLLSDKYLKGLNFSLINQALQILSFSIAGYAFMYLSGAAVLAGIKFEHSLTIDFNFSLMSEWRIYFASEDKIFQFDINLFAVFLIYLIDKFRMRIKREEMISDEHQSGRTPSLSEE